MSDGNKNYDLEERLVQFALLIGKYGLAHDKHIKTGINYAKLTMSYAE